MTSDKTCVDIAAVDTHADELRITTRRDIDALAASIRHLGLMHAPLLRRTKAGYTVICGFRRIEACRRLRMTSVPAHLVEAGISPLRCVELAVADNALQRPLDELELARCFRLLHPFYPRPEALSRAGRRLGLPAGSAYIRKLLQLTAMPPQIQQAVARGDISLAMVEALEKCEAPEAAALAEIFIALRPSLNKQREILQLCREIAAREGTDVAALLQAPELRSIIDDRDVDANRRVALLRTALRKRRMPALTRALEQFEAQVGALALGKELKLIPPAGFEGRVYRFELRFFSTADLRRQADRLRDLSEHPVMSRILERRQLDGD